MFELSKSELQDLRSNVLTTNVSPMSRNPTKVFNEKGLYMLATILKSKLSLHSLLQNLAVSGKRLIFAGQKQKGNEYGRSIGSGIYGEQLLAFVERLE